MNRSMTSCAILLALTLLGPDHAVAQAPGPLESLSVRPPPGVVKATTAWSVTGGHAGDMVALAIVIDIEPGWHINPDKSQVISSRIFKQVPTWLSVLETESDPALQAGPVDYPPGQTIQVDYGQPLRLKVYKHRVVLRLPIAIAADAKPGVKKINLELYYQACNATQCLMPTTVAATAQIEIVADDAPVTQTNAELFERFDPNPPPTASKKNDLQFGLFGIAISVHGATMTGYLIVLLLAAIGGLLLNFTPCVMPVIPIKIISLANAGRNSRPRTLGLGLVMVAGILAFWLAIGGAITLISSFGAINDLFQLPWFTIAVGAVIAMMAIGMCGLFSLHLPRWVYAINPQQGTLPGSFGFGIMTAVLSTPCTAPLMGTAAAWATQQPPATTLTTFLAIGAGMGLPYLLLAAFPVLVERVPRSGPGNELLKQVMGLFMLAAAAYFIGTGINGLITDGTTATNQAYWWIVFGFIAVGGGWLLIQSIRVLRSPIGRRLFTSVGAVIVVTAALIGVPMGATESGRIKWVYYTPAAFQDQIDAHRIVVMDFTADWCINCKVLETVVLESDRVVKLLDAPNVVPIKVDLTSRTNVDGNQMLRKMGRVTIPLLVVFATDGSVVFMGDTYGVSQVVDAVAEARSRRPGHAVDQ